MLSRAHQDLGFNPRSREGSDLYALSHSYRDARFNPRSREGSDFSCFRCLWTENRCTVSIHAPAKGATYLHVTERLREKVSIHAPAKGATTGNPIFKSDMQFQSTLPRRERLHTNKIFETIYSFNPRSREGSDNGKLYTDAEMMVSIHAPAKGATRMGESMWTISVFQSTLPRRERRYTLPLYLARRQSFNPRSREGSDPVCSSSWS